MLGDGAVDTENDRLRLSREIRSAHRAFHTFDSYFRTIHDFRHKILQISLACAETPTEHADDPDLHI